MLRLHRRVSKIRPFKVAGCVSNLGFRFAPNNAGIRPQSSSAASPAVRPMLVNVADVANQRPDADIPTGKTIRANVLSNNIEHDTNSLPKRQVSQHYSLINRELVGTMQRIIAEKSQHRDPSRTMADMLLRDGDNALLKRQLLVEEERQSEAVAAYTASFTSLMKMGRGTSVKSVQRILLGWYEPLRQAILEEREMILKGEMAVDRRQYGPYLMMVPIEKLAIITLDTCVNAVLRCGNTGEKLTKIALEIADIMEAEINIQLMKAKKQSGELLWWQDKQLKENEFITGNASAHQQTGSGGGSQRRVAKLISKKIRKIAKEEEWPKAKKVKVGVKLVELMLLSAKHDASGKSSFIYTKHFYKHLGKRQGFIRLEKDIYTKIVDKDFNTMLPRFFPMLVPPRRWSNKEYHGAYYRLKAPLMKAISYSQTAAVKLAHMEPVLQGLDYLGQTPWRVSKVMFDTITEAWRRNLPIGELPNTENLPIPSEETCYRPASELMDPAARKSYVDSLSNSVGAGDITEVGTNSAMQYSQVLEPADRLCGIGSDGIAATDTDKHNNNSNPNNKSSINNNSSGSSSSDDGGDRTVGGEQETVFDERLYTEMCRRVAQKNAELHSLRCDLSIKLGIAERFLGETIYFPHNIDFRGRAYPVPPNLSHLGSDLCRALLLFDEGKALGPEGLFWLKVHLANLFGHNKVSLLDRVAWVEQHSKQLLDSARDPLDGLQWWTEAESPFQALATCIEIKQAIDSGDPENYVCCLPVHQDGSCNGLQHYAGLGRDKPGAAAVNLIDNAQPQDVYSKVLEKVLQRVESDSQIPSSEEECPDEATRKKGDYARLVRGVVDRKVIKQTVMTSVYGVTKQGARAQVEARLREKFYADANIVLTPDKERELFRVAQYVAGHTLGSLEEMFQSAKEIMDWLAVCSQLVAKQGKPMSWVTPLGLPVIQPYRRTAVHTVRTVLQHVTLTVQADYLPVSTQKQKSAFPPNFVHSLDASHMLYTCLKMKDHGAQFAAVHDSYWTHAADVPFMSQALREAFVELYQQPILEDLQDALVMRFPDVQFPPIPERGSLDITSVNDSRYFFH